MTQTNALPREFEVIDYSVSKETFRLKYDEELDLYRTTPAPSPKDLPKYYESQDYISHHHQNRNLFEKIYGWVRRMSIKRKINLINAFGLQGKTILDYGCGTGDFLQACSEDGWQILGIEPNSEARQMANVKTDNKIYDGSLLEELQNNSIDVITLWHVLEHIPDYNSIIDKLGQVLAREGRIVVAVPNFNSYDAQFYRQYWAGFDVPRHLWHFSQNSISRIFRNHGFDICATHPLKFDSFYVSLLSEKYKNGNMNPLVAFYRGFVSNLKAGHSGEYSSLIYILKRV